VSDVLKAVAEKQGWQPADSLLRLEGGQEGQGWLQLVKHGLLLLTRLYPKTCCNHASVFSLPNCLLSPFPPPHAGFNEPWERVLFKGRELTAGASLAEQGVGSGAVLTAVRRVLVADGWKVRGAGLGAELLLCSGWVVCCTPLLPQPGTAFALHPPTPACLLACLPPCRPIMQIKALDEEDDSSSDEEEEESWVQKF
jgi:hypothetical protein